VPITALGPEIDPYQLRPSLVPLPRSDGDALIAEVLWVDRYGNCQLNLDPDELAPLGDVVGVRVGTDPRRSAKRVGAFAELAPGQVGLYVDSYGLISLALDQSSAADALHLHPGAEVRLEALA
jgi:S-adenosylmethionine hydrolase